MWYVYCVLCVYGFVYVCMCEFTVYMCVHLFYEYVYCILRVSVCVRSKRLAQKLYYWSTAPERMKQLPWFVWLAFAVLPGKVSSITIT